MGSYMSSWEAEEKCLHVDKDFFFFKNFMIFQSLVFSSGNLGENIIGNKHNAGLCVFMSNPVEFFFKDKNLHCLY